MIYAIASVPVAIYPRVVKSSINPRSRDFCVGLSRWRIFGNFEVLLRSWRVLMGLEGNCVGRVTWNSVLVSFALRILRRFLDWSALLCNVWSMLTIFIFWKSSSVRRTFSSFSSDSISFSNVFYIHISWIQLFPIFEGHFVDFIYEEHKTFM